MKGYVMKKLLMMCSIFPLLGHTAEDLSWTLQWGTNKVGVMFEDTNLTFSVKSSIRSDVARVLSFNSPSNATFAALSADDPYFGEFSGRVTMSHALVPSGFPIDYYKTCNGTNYFMIDAIDSTNYLSKIILTNQCVQEMKILDVFVNTVNKVTPKNFSPVTLASWYWSIKNDRVATLKGDFEGDTEELQEMINEISSEEFRVVSILDIAQDTLYDKTWLWAKLRIRNKTDPTDLGDIPILFRKGKWRFILGDEMP